MSWRDRLTEEERELVEWCRLPGGLATPLSRLGCHLTRILAEKDEHPADARTVGGRENQRGQG